MAPAEREAMLAAEPDDEVRKEVARLLAINPVHAMIDNPVMSPEYLDRFTNRAALLSEGELLGTRYLVEKRIASGGMGDVYAAYDKDLRERIAIKTIRPDIIANPAIVARFRREISLARRVSHPNVCRVFDLSQDQRSSDGRRVDFLTMELVEGETLSQLIKREAPMGFETARPLLEQICAGLAAAHDAGVVHRDFKGSNVLIARRPDGTLRAAVTDFGLARSVTVDGVSHESNTGLAGGTPAYMAPEQMEGRTVGPKADLYALGIVMYEMATGTAPHGGDSPLQIAVRRVTERPQAPRHVNPDIDPRWEEAILRCLEYKPEARPANARAVAALFGQERPLFTVPRWRMPRWMMPTLAGAVVVAGAAWWLWTRPPAHSEEALKWYRRGTDLLMDGAYSSARMSLEEALKHEKGFGAARARLADTFYELDMPDDAKREIGLASSADRRESLLIDGIRYSLQGKFPEALEKMSARVKQSNTSETLLDRARVLDRADRLDEAISAFQDVLQRDASNPGALLRLAQRLQAKGSRRDDALKALDAAHEVYRKSASLEGQAAVMLTRAELSEDKLAEAEEIAAKAEVLATQASSATLSVRAKLAQARYAAYQGHTDRSQQLAAEATDFATANGQAAAAAAGLMALAEIPYRKADYAKAAIGFREALNLAQRYGLSRTAAQSKQKLGDTLTRDHQIPEGLGFLEESRSYFATNGYSIEALRCRQIMADAIGRLNHETSKGIELQQGILKEALALPGAESLATRIRTSLGWLLNEAGQYPEAVKNLEEVVRAHVADGNRARLQYAQIQLGRMLTKLGRLTEAQSLFDGVLKDPAQSAYRAPAEFWSVLILVSRGNDEQALARLLKMEKETSDPQVRLAVQYRLCSLTAGMGTTQEAERRCTRLIPLTSAEEGEFGNLAVAITELRMTQKRWNEATQWGTRLDQWAVAHNDPEFRLLAPILLAEAFAKSGKEAERARMASVWIQRSSELEKSWGAENVKGMVSQPAFSRHFAAVRNR